jgi:hypothetical protein
MQRESLDAVLQAATLAVGTSRLINVLRVVSQRKSEEFLSDDDLYWRGYADCIEDMNASTLD